MTAKNQPGAETASQGILHYPQAPANSSPALSKNSLNHSEDIRDYLHRRLPGYPFDSELDTDYVEELVDDFPDINILAEIKAFRWYYNNKPFSGSKQPRVALRRWLENAWPAA